MAGHRLTPSLISLHLSSAPAENEDNNPLPPQASQTAAGTLHRPAPLSMGTFPMRPDHRL